MFDMGFNIYAFVKPQSTDDYARLEVEVDCMIVDDETSFEDIYFAEEVLEAFEEKFGDCEEAKLLIKKPPTMYAYDAVLMTAGEWCSRLGVSWQEFYEAIQALGSVEAAISEFVNEFHTEDDEGE